MFLHRYNRPFHPLNSYNITNENDFMIQTNEYNNIRRQSLNNNINNDNKIDNKVNNNNNNQILKEININLINNHNNKENNIIKYKNDDTENFNDDDIYDIDDDEIEEIDLKMIKNNNNIYKNIDNLKYSRTNNDNQKNDNINNNNAINRSDNSLYYFPPIPKNKLPKKIYKILVIGNAKCGKTSIIKKFAYNNFSQQYISTVGADYIKKDAYIIKSETKEGEIIRESVRLQLWDVAGQDRFAKLTRAYFKKARGVIIVCDVTRENTFEAIKDWKEEVDRWAETEEYDIPVLLFANKCDLIQNVTESFIAGAKMESTCRELGFSGWTVTSAKNGDNLFRAMHKLVGLIQKNDRDNSLIKRNHLKYQDNIKLSMNNNNNEISGGCCT